MDEQRNVMAIKNVAGLRFTDSPSRVAPARDMGGKDRNQDVEQAFQGHAGAMRFFRVSNAHSE
jgi:hypothetical protein